MTPHTVATFDAELKKLSAQVIHMGSTVGVQIQAASEAFRTRNIDTAKQVIAADHLIDDLQLRIEENVIHLIAKRQPVAVDLREIISTLKIATDLERMGDLAKNNAKRLIAMSGQRNPPGIGVNFDLLSARVLEQQSQVMQAYAQRDKDLARSVWIKDGEIDILHTALFRELLTYMMEDPRSIGYCAHLLFCAKNLERIGDHATNIAENIHFIIAGEFLSGDRPKGPSVDTALPTLEK